MSDMQKPEFGFPRSTGQLISVGIALYMIVKPVFNFIVLGGSIKPLAFGIAALICFWIGLKYSNMAVAVLLMLVACTNMPTNLKLIGFNCFLIYAIEGVIDMIAACVLAFHSEVRKHFDFFFTA
ncbi:MAG: hypothetical protein IKI58_09465 [Oscillospiraceae bacterium]|nr:hypothetical protein [Oscillospiraceae bacterium]